MSVIMVLQLDADPDKFEEVAAADPDRLKAIRDRAVGHGLIAHRFYGSDDGQLIVVDEWEKPEDFQAFFDEVNDDVQSLMSEVGVKNQPQPRFLRALKSGDEYGWEGQQT